MPCRGKEPEQRTRPPLEPKLDGRAKRAGKDGIGCDRERGCHEGGLECAEQSPVAVAGACTVAAGARDAQPESYVTREPGDAYWEERADCYVCDTRV